MERALLISAMIKGRPTSAKPSRINFRNELGLRRSHDEELASALLSGLVSARAIIFYPEFSWKDAPAETKSFALVLHDPDAPRAGGFTHWILYNIPRGTESIQENVPQSEKVLDIGTQGENDADHIGYLGPCPASEIHGYHARLYALDRELVLPPGATHEELNEAMQGHILAQAELMGKFGKKAERAA